MKFFKKSSMVLCLSMSLALVVSACGNQSSTGDSIVGKNEAAAKKTKLTLMIAWPGDEIGKKEEELVAKRFADKYDITFKPVVDPEKTIKTTIASGEPVDLAFYWTGNMDTFVDANMALDLTPYLDANGGEWKNTFVEGTLEKGTYKGKTFSVPITPVYFMMLANKDLLDKAGVSLPDQPTWEGFKNALGTVKEKLGITPFGNSWVSWTHAGLLFSVWPDDAKLQQWSKGEIPFTDPTVVKAFDETKSIYDKEYVYPGKGALTVTQDQILTAFKSEKIAIMAYINYQASKAVKDSGLKNVQVLSWPYMGSRTKVPGDANGYMIPANVKHPEASIEILKYLTSTEIAQHRVDSGAPVSVKGVKISDPKVAQYAKDAGNLYVEKDINALSPKINEYLNTKMPANYIFDPKKTLEDLEKLRLEAIEQKK
ncbi:ABC transporter substrate-binding protein [Paenibacillus sp. GCM10027628]|uniref:ABC transporter substrate-binding protein n=1 Tax=Paenibacillus sp. GCM10027628 TaxID=3273413 RepID=UPI0036438FD5